MLSLLSKYKGIIITVVVLVLIFFAYGAYMNNGSSSSSTSALSVTNSSTNVNTAASGPGKEFVTQLLAIQNIHFNTTLFSDPAYLYLQDFSHDLTPQQVGRDNPFAPIGEDGTAFTQTTSTANGGFVNTSTNQSVGGTTASSSASTTNANPFLTPSRTGAVKK